MTNIEHKIALNKSYDMTVIWMMCEEMWLDEISLMSMASTVFHTATSVTIHNYHESEIGDSHSNEIVPLI